MARQLYFGVSEQAKASVHRLADSRALLQAGRWRCAMYVAGYSVECLLKKKLMEMFGCDQLAQLQVELHRRGLMSAEATVFTHQLQQLLWLTGAANRMKSDSSAWSNFNVVNQWMPAWRYAGDLASPSDAVDFLNAVESTVHWISVNV